MQVGHVKHTLVLMRGCPALRCSPNAQGPQGLPFFVIAIPISYAYIVYYLSEQLSTI